MPKSKTNSKKDPTTARRSKIAGRDSSGRMLGFIWWWSCYCVCWNVGGDDLVFWSFFFIFELFFKFFQNYLQAHYTKKKSQQTINIYLNVNDNSRAVS